VQALENLADIIEKLCDVGQGMGWAKDRVTCEL